MYLCVYDMWIYVWYVFVYMCSHVCVCVFQTLEAYEMAYGFYQKSLLRMTQRYWTKQLGYQNMSCTKHTYNSLLNSIFIILCNLI